MPVISRLIDPRSRRIARRSTIATLCAAAIAVTSAMPATAAQPNNHACLGEDVRVYARGGAQFGGFVSTELADGGAGMEIQAHLAGLVPESTIPNACND